MKRANEGGRMEATRVQRVGLHILRTYGKEAGTIELNKLFYLIDATFYRMFGTTLSGLAYVRNVKGPYSAQIAQQLGKLDGHEVIKQNKPSKGNSEFRKVAWSIGPESRFEPNLRLEERETVEQVIGKIRTMSPRELENLSYQTEPMQEILKLEQTGIDCRDRTIRLSALEPDAFMRDCLAFRNVPLSEEDKEYHGVLEQEWAEFNSILQG